MVSVADGVITALKAGVATITAKVGDVISNEVTITVKNPAATAIAIAADKTELEVSQTAKITPTVTPAEYDGTLVYVVSDNTVVSVSADGVVTALKAGSAKITAKIPSRPANRQAKAIPQARENLPVRANPPAATLQIREIPQARATLLPVTDPPAVPDAAAR